MASVYELTLALLVAAALIALVRIARGPSELDRVVALDVLVILLLAGVAVEVAWRREVWNLALLGSVALLGFVGAVAAARLLELRSFEQADLDASADPEQAASADQPGGARAPDQPPGSGGAAAP